VEEEEEEEEEVGAYGSGSPIPWEDLAGEDGTGRTRGIFARRDNGAGLRVYTICPSYRRRGRSRGGATMRRVGVARG
jgi:hypothetical protein